MLAGDLATRISPNPDAMERCMDDGSGLIYAEAYSFALVKRLPWIEVQARVKALCDEAVANRQSLSDLNARDFPGLAPDLTSELGTAPTDARDFAAQASLCIGRRIPKDFQFALQASNSPSRGDAIWTWTQAF